MAGNDAFVIEKSRGWNGGLRNLMRAEFGKWFRTNMWWVQSLIWIAVINGILAGILWSDEGLDVYEAAAFMSLFMGLFPVIAIIIIMQDAIVGEKESGTAAWVLSKPVSRSSFVLSKLGSNLVGVLVTMVLLPAIIAYIHISIATSDFLDPLNFIGGLAVVYLNMVFYLTLTLMLGTFFSHRGPVIGIPLALAFGQQLILGMLPFLVEVLPWTLVIPFGEIELPIAAAVMRGVSAHSMNPLYLTIIFIIMFVVLSLWRFDREEF